MIESLLNQPFFSNLALTLLHFIWQGLFIGAVLWLSLQLISKDKATLRYGISALAMFANFCSPIITYIIVSKAELLQSAAQQSITFSKLSSTMPVLSQPGFTANLNHYLPYLSILYLVVLAFLACRLLWQTNQANNLKVVGVKLADDTLQQKLSEFAKQIGLAKTPQLLISLKAQTPMVVGWLKPVILLPASMMSGLSSAQLEMLLLHELAHVRRHDYLVNVLQCVVEMLLFYHPSVRWASKQMRQEREYCSDDIALHHCANPIAYAHTLTDTAAMCRHHIPQMAMAASGGDLKLRVVRIVEHHCTSDKRKESYLQGLAPLMVISTLVLASMTKFYNASGLDFILSSTPLLKGFENIKQPLSSNTLAQQLLNNKISATRAQAESEEHMGSFAPQFDIQAVKPSQSAVESAVKVITVASTQEPETVLPIEKPTQSHTMFSASKDNQKLVSELTQPTPELITEDTQSKLESVVIDAQESDLTQGFEAVAEQFELAQGQNYEPVISEPFANNYLYAEKPLFIETKSSENDRMLETNYVASEPVVIESFQPHYPKAAKRKRIETEVKVSFTIDKNGRVIDISFADQFGVGVFKQSIRNAMKKWRYQPAKVNGQPIESQMTKIFDFNLVT